jgi:hypothetical protein
VPSAHGNHTWDDQGNVGYDEGMDDGSWSLEHEDIIGENKANASGPLLLLALGEGVG